MIRKESIAREKAGASITSYTTHTPWQGPLTYVQSRTCTRHSDSRTPIPVQAVLVRDCDRKELGYVIAIAAPTTFACAQ